MAQFNWQNKMKTELDLSWNTVFRKKTNRSIFHELGLWIFF